MKMIEGVVYNDEKDWFVEKVDVGVRTHMDGDFRSLSVTVELNYLSKEHANTMRLSAVDDALHLIIPGALVTHTPIMAKFVAMTEEIDNIQRTINAERWEEKRRKPLTWWQKLRGYHYPKTEKKDPRSLVKWFLNRVRPSDKEEREKYEALCNLEKDYYRIVFEDHQKQYQMVALVFERTLLKRSVYVEMFDKDPQQAFQRLTPFIEMLEKGGVHNFGITNFRLLRDTLASNTSLSSTPAE